MQSLGFSPGVCKFFDKQKSKLKQK